MDRFVTEFEAEPNFLTLVDCGEKLAVSFGGLRSPEEEGCCCCCCCCKLRPSFVAPRLSNSDGGDGDLDEVDLELKKQPMFDYCMW